MQMENPLITAEQGSGIEERIVKLLEERRLTVTTAESCTGGLIAGRLVNVPGASAVFERGFVTYSNQAKTEELGVEPETLRLYGAVSAQTAKQMARGAAAHARADVAIAVTGLAGPDGGTPEKPVGLVYIALYYDGAVSWRKCRFSGSRAEVREQTVVNALHLLEQVLTTESEMAVHGNS